MTFMSFPVSPPPQPIQQPASVSVTIKYVVAVIGGHYVFMDPYPGSPRSFSPGYYVATQPHELIQFIDPISAVWMGLLKLEELKLSDQTLAVLKLTMEEAV